MPEQNEWNDAAEAHSDSGDYTWKPEYTRRTAPYYVLRVTPAYDTRTLAQKLDDATKRIAWLEAENKLIRALLDGQVGTL